MPLSDDLKYRLGGFAHDVTPESEPLRAKAKWHAERAGSLKHAKISKVGKNIYHAELEERSHPGHTERRAPVEDNNNDEHDFAFR